MYKKGGHHKPSSRRPDKAAKEQRFSHESDHDEDDGFAKGGNFMKKAFGKHPGLLHKKLHVPQGEKIPAKKLAKAAKSKSGALRKEVALARVGRKYGKH